MRHGHCYTISTLFYWICGHDNDPFNSWQWYVQYAPYPDDIQWYDTKHMTKILIYYSREDIGLSSLVVWTMTIVMNILIIVVFAFISTPAQVLNIIKQLMPLQSQVFALMTTTISKTDKDPLVSCLQSG